MFLYVFLASTIFLVCVFGGDFSFSTFRVLFECIVGRRVYFEYFLSTLWNTQKVVVFFECEKNIIASTMSSGKPSKTHCLLHHCFWPAWRVWGLGCYFPSRPPPPHTQTMLRFRKFEAISNPCLAAAPGRPFIGSSPVLAPVLRRWLGHRFDWFMMTKHTFPGLAVELARWMPFWECEWRFVFFS